MKIFITGATGFIGKNLCSYLASKEGIQILALSRRKYGKDIDFLKNLGAKLVLADIFDTERIRKVIRGVDCVVHLVGGGNVSSRTKEEYKNLYRLNVESTKALIKAIKASNWRLKKFIYLSSISAIGVYHGVVVDERASERPHSVHEICKYEAEKIVKNSGLPYLILRPAAVYGPMARVSDILLIAKVIKKIRIFPVIGKGNNTVPFIDIDDVVEAICLCLYFQKTGRIFILVHEKSPTFNQLVRVIGKQLCGEGVVFYPHIPKRLASVGVLLLEKAADVFGFNPLITKHRLHSMTSDRVFDISLIKKELGYKEKYTLEKGIKKTIKWYQENQWL